MKKAKSLLALILAMLIAFGSVVCATAVEDPAETEENGTIATADVFGLGTSIKGKLADENDADYFAFTAADSGLVTVTLKHDKKTGVDPVATYFAITVYDATGTNAIESAKAIRATIAEMRKSFPPGMDCVVGYDITEYTIESINAVYQTIFEAVLLVIVVILLFMQNIIINFKNKLFYKSFGNANLISLSYN